MNKTILTGFICSEIGREVDDNNQITKCSFRVASFDYKDKDTNENIYNHILCIAYKNMAKYIYDNFMQQHKVLIFGSFHTRSYKDKNYVYDNSISKEENAKRQIKNLIYISVEYIEYIDRKRENDTNDKENDIIDNLDNVLNKNVGEE